MLCMNNYGTLKFWSPRVCEFTHSSSFNNFVPWKIPLPFFIYTICFISELRSCYYLQVFLVCVCVCLFVGGACGVVANVLDCIIGVSEFEPFRSFSDEYS